MDALLCGVDVAPDEVGVGPIIHKHSNTVPAMRGAQLTVNSCKTFRAANSASVIGAHTVTPDQLEASARCHQQT